MTQVFSYKPALLAARLDYHVGPGGLVCRAADGAEKWRLDWRDVTAAAFVEHKVKGNRFRRLDLRCGGERRSISCTGGPGDPAADPDAAAHLDLAAAILDQLAALDDGLMVTVGEYGRSRLAIFGVGAASVLGGVGLAGLALATGVSSDRLGAGAVPVLLLLAMGAALMTTHAPWRRPPVVPAAPFAQALRQIAHPEPSAGRAD